MSSLAGWPWVTSFVYSAVCPSRKFDDLRAQRRIHYPASPNRNLRSAPLAARKIDLYAGVPGFHPGHPHHEHQHKNDGQKPRPANYQASQIRNRRTHRKSMIVVILLTERSIAPSFSIDLMPVSVARICIQDVICRKVKIIDARISP